MGWRENSYHVGQSGNNSPERHLIAEVNRSAIDATFAHRAYYVCECAYVFDVSAFLQRMILR